MDAEIQQLVGMGFAADLAAEAIAAADGDLHKATDWLLNHITTDKPQPISHCQSNSISSPIIQPKIDRFFNFHTKKDPSPPISQKIEVSECDAELNPLIPRKKRQKISQNPEYSAPAPPPHAPLAERMRPRVLDEVVGQDHILSKDSLLRSAITSNRLPSIILWGPPGAGKTSIAKAMATSCGGGCYRFVALSAVTCGVKDIRETVEKAIEWKTRANRRTVLFLDEVHRFNKAQQDSFLPIIEDGSITFIGATTENPSFHLITPLLSRCRVLRVNPLKPEHIAMVLNKAICDEERGLICSFDRMLVKFEVSHEAIELLSMQVDGDARVALNALEVAATTAATRAKGHGSDLGVECGGGVGVDNVKEATTAAAPGGTRGDECGVVGIDNVKEATTAAASGSDSGVKYSVVIVGVDDAKEALQCKHLAYDKAGEEHYNLISALHKSMRGGDGNAAIYWLARMLEGGEEPLYIARRLIRFASEDVGLADPQALIQAVSCYQACHFIGMPECNVVLAQCVVYLALAEKSVAVYRAIEGAQKAVRESVGQNEGVPLHLRNAPTKLMKDVGYGKGYVYPPDETDPASLSQTYMPPSLEGCKFLHWP